jgi:glutamate racemase
MDDRPVGVFDSGVGGLSVLRAIRNELPAEDVIYAADSRHAPYGDRPRAFIEQRSIAIATFLVSQSVKAIVVASNTATAAAAAALREQFEIPIVAMEPAIKPAALLTKTGIVGILATASTLSSEKFHALVDQHGRDIEVLVQPCPGLVERVEEGDLDSAETLALVEQFVRPLLDGGADTLVLGCTHYPFLRPVIEAVAGRDVTVIDPAVAVAREVRRRLDVAGLLASPGKPGRDEFWSSGERARVASVMSQLWTQPVSVNELPVVRL